MKKLSLVLLAAGLVSLAACDKQTPTQNAADNATVENAATALDSNAAEAADNAVAADNAADNAAEDAK